VLSCPRESERVNLEATVSVFIDFDGTITPVHGFSEEPSEEVVRAINELYDSGFYEIVIYSCRANIEICDHSDVEKMEEYLKRNGIKYHRVQEGKPLYNYIIDDRAFNPNTTPWEKICDTILGRTSVEPDESEEDTDGEVAEE
jgi:hypothetical protein